MSLLDTFPSSARVFAIGDLSFGDCGKGRFIDLLAGSMSLVCRSSGGANAGHTIVSGGIRLALHLVPSGILHDASGVENVIGTDVALDPRILIEEMGKLRNAGLTHTHLFISHQARLVLPQHLLLDRIGEMRRGSGKIGTTGKGIGPCYTDHVARRGLIVNDLQNPDVFTRKLRENLASYRRMLTMENQENIEAVMHHPELGSGVFFHPEKIFDEEAIIGTYLAYTAEMPPIIDTDARIAAMLREGKRILLEGAQGHLLSITRGTYPFVTSSDCTFDGLARGAGLRAPDIDVPIGVIKAYMTRVGRGPFPTELGGHTSDAWCNNPQTNKESEATQHPHEATPPVDNDFRLGVWIRQKGGEYGATTGRPRRTGWLDLPLLRYACSSMPNGGIIALTKLDVLSALPTIKLCTSYRYEGPDYRIAGSHIVRGDSFSETTADSDVLSNCAPQCEQLAGWGSDVSAITDESALPPEASRYLARIEAETNVPIRIVSVGPERHQFFIRS